MKTQYLVLGGTLGGAFIGALSTLITTWVSKVYDNKRAFNELLISTAIKNWEISKEIAIQQAEKSGKQGKLSPLDLFIIHQSKITKLIVEDKLTEETLKNTLEENHKLLQIFSDYTQKVQNQS